MLNQERVKLLLWLRNRPEPVSMNQMDQLQAPGFSWERVEKLKKEDLLSWTYIAGEDGNLVAGYFVSDKGLAILEAMEQERKKEAEAKRQQRFQNQMTIAQVLIPLVTFLLGLVIEHYAGLISSFSQFLGRWIK